MPSPAPSPPPRKPVSPNTKLVLALALGVLAILTWRVFQPGNPGLAPRQPNKMPAENAQGQRSPQPQALPAAQPGNQPSISDVQIGKLAAQLANAQLDSKLRRQAARELGRHGSDQAIEALRKALPDAPGYLKTAIGEALGQSVNRQARALALELVGGADEAAARGAIRGLGDRADAEAIEVLANVIANSRQSQGLRMAAALALGEASDPAALAALTRAVREVADPEVVASALEALGQRPLAETEPFFREYLANPGLSDEAKIAALDALGNSTGDVAALLMKFASDPNPQVRSAAAWGLSATHTEAKLGDALTSLLRNESDAEVRMRLFEALAGQQEYDRRAVLPLLARETDPAARLAGLALAADWVHTTPESEYLGFFNQTAVPQLKIMALNDSNPTARLSAVMALRRGRTPEAAAALVEIAGQSTDARVVQAAKK